MKKLLLGIAFLGLNQTSFANEAKILGSWETACEQDAKDKSSSKGIFTFEKDNSFHGVALHYKSTNCEGEPDASQSSEVSTDYLFDQESNTLYVLDPMITAGIYLQACNAFESLEGGGWESMAIKWNFSNPEQATVAFIRGTFNICKDNKILPFPFLVKEQSRSQDMILKRIEAAQKK